MGTPYAGIPSGANPDCLGRLPLEYQAKDGRKLVITTLRDPEDIPEAHAMLNEVIAEGLSYPYEEELDEAGFRAYFLSHDAFGCFVEDSSGDTDGLGELVGIFYIKPNFPGRCGHICNGGFITKPSGRGNGVATAMGTAFTLLAPDLGYRASFFNLVFASNEASVGLWRKLGFQQTGVVPNAARIITGEYVDAYQFYNEFVSPDNTNTNSTTATATETE